MFKNLKKSIAVVSVMSLLALSMVGCGGSDAGKDSKTASAYSDLIQSYTDVIEPEWGYDIAYELSYDEDMAGECGFRTAGSDYEHLCADYLEDIMTSIGLEDIEKVGVSVDKWQFNDASLKIDGTKIKIMPASYAQSGTDEDGINAAIVDVGSGFAEDYAGVDVRDKIVLAGVNQVDDAWIDGYIHEAYLNGAAALVTYDIGGYAQASDDIRNIQDVCTDDYIPTVSISAKEAKSIQKAIKDGKDSCTLVVDNEIAEGEGTSYNVIGKIKGVSSDQQIVISAHYDKYFAGFQDDSIAVANVLSIAKAMKDMKYKPQNDIVFVCHGAEEWGASGTQYDWTTGAWEMINNARPEWADKTLAMFNFELSGYDTGQKAATIASVPEYYSFVSDFVGSELSDIVDMDVYEGGISEKNEAVTTMEDGMSYRFAGVPYFLNGGGIDSDFATQKYHTEMDDETTYNPDVFKQNTALYGAMAIVTDQSPAIELNLGQMAKWLEESYNEEWAAEAGAEGDDFNAELSKFKESSKAAYDEAIRINEEYEKAYEAEDQKTMSALREEGKAYNSKILKAFKVAQSEFLCVVSSWDILTRHEGAIQTLELLDQTIKAAEAGEIWAEDEESGAADIAWQLNGAVEYGYYIFTPEGVRMTEDSYFDNENNYWGNDKTVPFVDTSHATIAMVHDEDNDTAIRLYKKAMRDFLPNLYDAIERETDGLRNIDVILNN